MIPKQKNLAHLRAMAAHLSLEERDNLQLVRSRRDSSGAVLWSSCYHALPCLLDWAMSGGSPTLLMRMVEELSSSHTWWSSSSLVDLSTSWSCPLVSSLALVMSRFGTWFLQPEVLALLR